MENVIRLLEEKIEFHQNLVDHPEQACKVMTDNPTPKDLAWMSFRQKILVAEYKKAIRILEEAELEEYRKYEKLN